MIVTDRSTVNAGSGSPAGAPVVWIWAAVLAIFFLSGACAPDHPLVYGRMAACYGALGQHEMAAGVLKKALQVAPDYTVALNGLALHHLWARRIEDADRAAREALEHSPHNAEAQRMSRLIERRRAAMMRGEPLHVVERE